MFADEHGLFPFKTIADVLEENQRLKEEVECLNDVISSNISDLSEQLIFIQSEYDDLQNQHMDLKTEFDEKMAQLENTVNSVVGKMVSNEIKYPIVNFYFN